MMGLQMAGADIATRADRDERGRFVTGNSGGGRPRGARNKLSEAFLEALYADFQEHGPEAIAETRLTAPSVYLRVVAGLLPKVTADETADDYQNMSADELRALIRQCVFADGQD
jgi:hypothetical protein